MHHQRILTGGISLHQMLISFGYLMTIMAGSSNNTEYTAFKQTSCSLSIGVCMCMCAYYGL
jgi:hypothetical protein